MVCSRANFTFTLVFKVLIPVWLEVLCVPDWANILWYRLTILYGVTLASVKQEIEQT
jgi:hypothetical protein